MYNITKKDKNDILNIILKNDGKTEMQEIMRKYSYANTKKQKEQKILEVIKSLNRDLTKTVRVKLVIKTVKIVELEEET